MYFTYIYLEKIHFKSVSSRFSPFVSRSFIIPVQGACSSKKSPVSPTKIPIDAKPPLWISIGFVSVLLRDKGEITSIKKDKLKSFSP